MKKTIILILIILLCSCVIGSSVTRTLSTSIDEGADLYVDLTVSLDVDDTIIAIEETIPSTFTISDANGGTSQQSNTLQWIETDVSGTIVYRYKLNVGSSTGTKTFSGKFVAETDTVETTISGSTSITVNALIPTCTINDWDSTDGACQPTGTLTRTWTQVNTACQGGTNHDPLIETITCDYTAPTCTSFTYDDWSTCSQLGTQTTTILTKTPTGCNDTTSITSRGCTFIPTCTIDDWDSSDGACQSNNELTRTWTNLTNCENGVNHNPLTETITCNYTAPTCTSFTYDDWSTCSQLGTQTTTILTKTPTGCNDTTSITSRGCTYTPPCTDSHWDFTDGACQPTDTLTRTWITPTDCEGGVNHNPLIETITCDYTAPTCTSFTYDDWSTCSQQGDQTTTILTKTPTGCNDTTSITSRSCTYVPTCLEENWTPTLGACQSNNTQIVNWEKTLNCEDGVSHEPIETTTCNYDAPTCTSFTYSNYGSCQQVSGSTGIKLRTMSTKTPTNCEGGTQDLTQDCVFIPQCTDAYWTYTLGNCIDDAQLKTWTKTAECIGGVPRPDTEEIACLSIDEIPDYCGNNDWEYRIEPSVCPSTKIQTKYWTKNKDCQGGITKAPQETINCTYTPTTNPDPIPTITPPNTTTTCTSFTYSEWEDCSPNGNQSRTIVSKLPANCTGGSPILTQTCTSLYPDTAGTPCGTNYYHELGICCENNWNKGIDSCEYDISNIMIKVEQSNNEDALELIDNAQRSINKGEITKGRAQAQLALLKSKLEDNPELVEAYNNALLALEEEDYDEAEELAISALDVAIENLYPNDQMNQIIIIAGVIFAIMVIILIFGRKPEPKLPKPKVKIKPKVKTTKLSESEELLNKLRDEFK
jgi:hypothetical protein